MQAVIGFVRKSRPSHQQVVEAFSLSFDGSKALIGKEEFQVDETLIAEVEELPRTGEKWFKTTITKNVEFKSYLKTWTQRCSMEEKRSIHLARGEVAEIIESNLDLHNLWR